MSVNSDQAIFDAIAAATDHNDDGIFISVQKFIDTFNSHRDRKLCTSIDVAQSPGRIEQLEAALRAICNSYTNGVPTNRYKIARAALDQKAST